MREGHQFNRDLEDEIVSLLTCCEIKYVMIIIKLNDETK